LPLETDFLLQRAVTFQNEPPARSRAIFDGVLQPLGLGLASQEFEAEMSTHTYTDRVTVRENLDGGPRKSFRFDDFVGLPGS